MKSKTVFLKRSFALMLVLLLLLECAGCCLMQPKVKVAWLDADGTLIEYSEVSSNYDPRQRELPANTSRWEYTGWEVTETDGRIECRAIRVSRTRLLWKDYDGTILKEEYIAATEAEKAEFPLPNDTEDWHYTQWSKNVTTTSIIYTAVRVKKETHIWKDYDGTVLKEEKIPEGEDLPETEFPADDGRWTYTEWETEEKDGKQIHTAVRLPNAEYFVGNVFQIVIKDRNGEPLGTGSGFVLNEEGWFITNNHVMEDATTAYGYFDIPDPVEGGRYTQLEILGGVYHSEEKDIFIGKLAGYEKIKPHYKNITFTEKYAVGEKAYTLGYPNSSIKMEIHGGEILEEYSDILDKINGVYYVLSDAYIAPGSSGGILINESFQVVGITAIGLYEDSYNQVYTAGGSIPTEVFAPKLNNLDESKLQKLTAIYS